jgi:uncharacterized phage protein (TIGR02216 family)
MHFGLGVLRLAPSQFWAMSPRELLAAAGFASARERPDRSEFEALMDRFPDRKREKAPHGPG